MTADAARTPSSEEPGFGINTAGYVVLVDGAEPEPVRRGPQEYPERGPAPSSDHARLERVLHERMPDAVGASERELAVLEERLGEPLPSETLRRPQGRLT